MCGCLAHIKMRRREPVEKLDIKSFLVYGECRVNRNTIHLCKKISLKKYFCKDTLCAQKKRIKKRKELFETRFAAAAFIIINLNEC